MHINYESKEYKYRLSASFIKKWEQCKFSIFCKITKQQVDQNLNSSYGDAGNVVHKTLEYYYLQLLELDKESALTELKVHFEVLWEHANIQNPKIMKNLYWLCVINGVNLNIDFTDIEYEFNKTKAGEEFFVGFADIMNRKLHTIDDWKTSTYKKSKLKEYQNQLRFYAWGYYQKFGIIPKTSVYFNKVNKRFFFKFDVKSMQLVDQTLETVYKEIQSSFKNINFPRNDEGRNCFFCPYKGVCSSDLLRKKKTAQDKTTLSFIFHLKKNKLLIEGDIPESTHKYFENKINYEIKNAHYMKAALMKKGIRWDGIKHLYKRKPFGAETFIGYLHLINNHFKANAKLANMNYVPVIKDFRDTEVMDNKLMKEIPKLNFEYDFYDFQMQAVAQLIKHRWGICEIGTGGGKTVIAAECIRRLRTTTLFIIDNKDLLFQTKKDYEDLLGIKVGVVGIGKREWDHVLVVATIQTLAKYAKEWQHHLAQRNLIIYDEAHIIASKSFETISKYLVNSRYRFGFSATAKRDDGNDNIIYAHAGTKVFVKPARDLIAEDVLVPPTSIFYDYGSELIVTDNYQNEYTDGIVDNEKRNKFIVEIVNEYINEGKQIMILCKRIRHCEILLKMLPGAKLIYGKTEDDIRKEVMQEFKEGKFHVLIGNIKIFNKGINIKILDVIVNAAGNAGDVLTVQSIGRCLRKAPGKEKAYYIDFIDVGTYLKKHSRSRIKALKAEEYKVEIITRNLAAANFSS